MAHRRPADMRCRDRKVHAEHRWPLEAAALFPDLRFGPGQGGLHTTRRALTQLSFRCTQRSSDDGFTRNSREFAGTAKCNIAGETFVLLMPVALPDSCARFAQTTATGRQVLLRARIPRA